MKDRRRITIFDTTLRDGEQSPGIALSPDEKVEIALALERLGVDVIEAGFAFSSPGDFEGVRAVSAAVTEPTVCSFARAHAEDLDAAVEALADARGRTRIHVVLATSPIHMEHKLGLEPRRGRRARSTRRLVRRRTRRRGRVLLRGRDSLRRFLRRRGVPRRDRGRSDDDQPPRHGRLHVPRGVRRVPAARFAGSAPSSSSVTLSVHCHDDLGLAVANTLAGIQAGATQAECTINGLGERAGNAALEEVVMAFRVRTDALGYETGVDVSEIGRVSQLVSRLTGYGSSATRRSSAQAHSPTRPASTRTGCSRTPRPTRSWIRRSSASR